MKKLLMLIMVVSFAFLTFAGTSLANNGPHLGPGMPQDTDACAGCHRAHSGTADDLLKEGATQYDFCISCHDGTGANTNVKGGTFAGLANLPDGTNWGTDGHGTPGAGLNGGGFETAVAYTGINNRAGAPAAVTSKHNVDAQGTAWGGGSANGGPGTSMLLKCSSCHDPHGAKDKDAQGNWTTERYRILRYDIDGDGLDSGVSSNETTIDYTTTKYKSGISDYCIECHSQYKANGDYDAGDGLAKVHRERHPMDAMLQNGDILNGSGTVAGNLNNPAYVKLPVGQNSFNATVSGNDRIICLTCHQAHGTSAAVSQNSIAASPAKSGALLRLKDRGVCQDCHQK